MNICPKCKSGNVTIKTKSIPEYPDAEIKIEAKITEDNKIIIKFTAKGSYYLDDDEEPIMVVCENGHKTELHSLDEELATIISESICVNSEEHVCQRTLKQ